MANNGLKLSSSPQLKNTLRSALIFSLGGILTFAALILFGAIKTQENTISPVAAPTEKVDKLRLAELETYKRTKEAEEAEITAADAIAAEAAKTVSLEKAIPAAKQTRADLSNPSLYEASAKKASSSMVAFNQASASINGAAGLVKWSTSSEANSSLFLVERSVDGINFSPMGMKVSKGNSNKRSNYEFEDKNLKEVAMPKVFYRVRHVSLNGVSTYANKVEVNLPAKLGLYTQVTGEKSAKKITLQYAADSRRSVNMKITDTKGGTVLEKMLSASPVSKSLDLDVNSWPKGSYYMHIFDDMGSTTETFVLK